MNFWGSRALHYDTHQGDQVPPVLFGYTLERDKSKTVDNDFEPASLRNPVSLKPHFPPRVQEIPHAISHRDGLTGSGPWVGSRGASLEVKRRIDKRVTGANESSRIFCGASTCFQLLGYSWVPTAPGATESRLGARMAHLDFSRPS